jgi:hypothetical protein
MLLDSANSKTWCHWDVTQPLQAAADAMMLQCASQDAGDV